MEKVFALVLGQDANFALPNSSYHSSPEICAWSLLTFSVYLPLSAWSTAKASICFAADAETRHGRSISCVGTVK